MTINRFFEGIRHGPRRLLREVLFYLDLAVLWCRNRLSRAVVTNAGAPVVSLTSHGRRVGSVYLAIESIASGSLRPSRLILWIDDEIVYRSLPQTLLRLQRRGLEIKLCRSYGPHTKYYPYVESQHDFHVALVTADDDIVYPRDWLSALAKANTEFPNAINCWWAHKVTMKGQTLDRYIAWENYGSVEPSFANLMLGVMGVCYPPGFLSALKNAGDGFRHAAERTDDLWLHLQAIRSGFRIRQIFRRPPYLTICRCIPRTDVTALSHHNDFEGGNDRTIRAMYTEADTRRILSDLQNLVV